MSDSPRRLKNQFLALPIELINETATKISSQDSVPSEEYYGLKSQYLEMVGSPSTVKWTAFSIDFY